MHRFHFCDTRSFASTAKESWLSNKIEKAAFETHRAQEIIMEYLDKSLKQQNVQKNLSLLNFIMS